MDQIYTFNLEKYTTRAPPQWKSNPQESGQTNTTEPKTSQANTNEPKPAELYNMKKGGPATIVQDTYKPMQTESLVENPNKGQYESDNVEVTKKKKRNRKK